MNTAHQLVAVPAADVDAESLGAIVMWSLNGAVDYTKLAESWAAHGLDPSLLPSMPTPVAALAHAVRDVCAGRHFPRRIDGGWVIVEEHTTQDGAKTPLRWKADAVVTLDPVGLPVVEPAGHPITESVEIAFRNRIDTLTTSVFGHWLAGVAAEQCLAVTVRPNGGVYHVPPTRMPLWRAVVDAVHDGAGHRVTLVPAMRCADAVESVLAALIDETKTEAAKLNDEINSGDYGARALRSRAGRASALSDKLEEYEGVLDRSLADLRARLDEIGGAAVQAAFALEAE